jgi:hypothetical protein
MAVLTSCINEEDTFVEAATYDPNNKNAVVGNGASTKVTTEQLQAIKNPLLTIKLSDANAANLKKVGGYVRISQIVVAQVAENSNCQSNTVLV